MAASKSKSKPKKKPAKAKPKPKPTAKKTKTKPKPKQRGAKASRSAFRAAPAKSHERALGDIQIPSGKLAIFDIGLVGFLPREALEPAIVTCDVPADRPLHVVGVPVGKGRFASCWDYIAVQIADGEVDHSTKLGEAGVDFARLVCMDLATLDAWQHEDSLDGKADFVFWGRDAAVAARSLSAPRITDGYGWRDLSVAQAEARGDELARKKAANKWLLASDLRPHSHHYQVLAAARASARGAGTLELAGATLLLFFTSWGDGVFPIYADRDASDRLVRVRIQLATAESNAAMAEVNP